ncbi:MAG: hypothetical protein ACRD5J_05190 [Nitrososphaeraceae archaeon]
MSNGMLNLFVIVVVVLASIAVFNYNVIFASFDEEDDDDDDESILPNYREGYEVGKVHGIEDNRSGNVHNDRCPPGDNDILWCIGYEIGYNDGYYVTNGNLT